MLCPTLGQVGSVNSFLHLLDFDVTLSSGDLFVYIIVCMQIVL